MQLRDKDTAVHYLWQGDCHGWRLCDTPDLAVTREAMPAGRSETRHRHARARQVFYCLSGTLDIEVGGETLRLGPGQSVMIAPGTPHIVHAAEASDFLVISAPSTRDDRTEA